jgi:iron complex transport system ATP-binding protein
MSFLSVHDLTAGYGRQPVIERISFQLEAGCLMGIIGANGCGKTTLLKALCGILPHQGSCTLAGRILEQLSPRQIARQISYIPQRSGVSIDIAVLDVVLMGFNPQLGLLEHPTRRMKEAAHQALKQVGLGDKAEENYLHLSEGQKQLCILARTLVSDSSLLLLDEPESALDFRFRHQMLRLLRAWVASGNRSAVVTLHDPTLALNCCDRLLLLDGCGVLGTLEPRSTPLDDMERMLSRVYGSISLQRCQSRKGESQIVILREDDT